MAVKCVSQGSTAEMGTQGCAAVSTSLIAAAGCASKNVTSCSCRKAVTQVSQLSRWNVPESDGVQSNGPEGKNPCTPDFPFLSWRTPLKENCVFNNRWHLLNCQSQSHVSVVANSQLPVWPIKIEPLEQTACTGNAGVATQVPVASPPRKCCQIKTTIKRCPV